MFLLEIQILVIIYDKRKINNSLYEGELLIQKNKGKGILKSPNDDIFKNRLKKRFFQFA